MPKTAGPCQTRITPQAKKLFAFAIWPERVTDLIAWTSFLDHGPGRTLPAFSSQIHVQSNLTENSCTPSPDSIPLYF